MSEEAVRDRPDVVLAGPLFCDLVMTGLPRFPANGEEIRVARMATAPGGVANMAIAASRLGLRTALATAAGADGPGRFCWSTLLAEGIDLTSSRICGAWTTPLTVSITHDGDRRMITHETPPPVDVDALLATAPAPRAALVDLGHLGDAGAEWVARVHGAGAVVIADIGFDETGRWDPAVLDNLRHCDVFTPNAIEAMAFTRTATALDAARALSSRVPLAVVTDGANGAWAVESATGTEVHADAVPVAADDVVDATGAGDVFGAGLAWATLAGLPLVHRLDLAALCSSLAVRGLTGSMGAPGWAEIGAWRNSLGPSDTTLARRYAFLEELGRDAPPSRPAPTSIPWEIPGTPRAVEEVGA